MITTKQLNWSISQMFKEHHFVRSYRKSVRKSILFYIKQYGKAGFNQLMFRGEPVVMNKETTQEIWNIDENDKVIGKIIVATGDVKQWKHHGKGKVEPL
jgi:hypothetical protein